ncbi:phosphatidate cytidylyltransferase [Varunaivibrio sulfuroxidans]|uniref:phosphatidate cytidylyltransferase n=1 Tax=Varunaivibrio sulfuroxidans TaxID=1773489 RepID=UPI001FB48755|nr:phosphatidate cytidylyltransferase [Varunaivibrio sulfuroxidans]WES31396.1 phosphatidate cytidylyltransferase [Varunaivibrio sulfuroxidans]
MAEKTALKALTRVASAVVLAPLAIWAVFAGTPYFEVMVVAGGAVLIYEWSAMVGGRPSWLTLGVGYVGLACIAFMWLRGDTESGFLTVTWLFGAVWATDIGAYVFGLSIGGPKLAPKISPKKTWAGLIGGMTCAAACGAAIGYFLAAAPALWGWAAFSAFIGAVSQGGDLFESWVKRRFGLKDSGAIIPGHGGLFDRVDGLLSAILVTALINALLRSNVLLWL